MGETWLRKSQRFVKENLTGCVGDVVLSSNDVGNFHQCVVNHRGKIVGWTTV
ncbi:uncharacterized protein METZ01_LOCUS388010 [marine metagenome]|uniref:Uncharacterized protein n=1 Tax=marine metagenome TaxID=408172 RepID=A0A382ULK4_9ZZZZ